MGWAGISEARQSQAGPGSETTQREGVRGRFIIFSLTVWYLYIIYSIRSELIRAPIRTTGADPIRTTVADPIRSKLITSGSIFFIPSGSDGFGPKRHNITSSLPIRSDPTPAKATAQRVLQTYDGAPYGRGGSNGGASHSLRWAPSDLQSRLNLASCEKMSCEPSPADEPTRRHRTT